MRGQGVWNYDPLAILVVRAVGRALSFHILPSETDRQNSSFLQLSKLMHVRRSSPGQVCAGRRDDVTRQEERARQIT